MLYLRTELLYTTSFVPIGKRQKSLNVFAAIWHEGQFRRSKDKLISTFYKFILKHRDIKHITLWLDICSAQNKNWLFCFFIFIINSDKINTEDITLRFFKPGHFHGSRFFPPQTRVVNAKEG